MENRYHNMFLSEMKCFLLKPYLLRPYSRNSLGDNEPNKIFNYRLLRARRVVGNAFGILAARWRCFRGHIEVQPEFVDKIVLASCCLHNMLCTDNEFELEFESNQPPENAFLNIDALRKIALEKQLKFETHLKMILILMLVV